MRAHRGHRIGFLARTSVSALLLAAAAACSDSPVTAPTGAQVDGLAARGGPGADLVRFTGTADLVWIGGQGAGAPTDGERTAQATLAAFPGTEPGSPGPGRFAFRVRNALDGTVHREIGATLIYAHIEESESRVWYMGLVDSDTRVCSDSPGGGGDDGAGCSHDDGGCSHDDGTTHDDGGCSGDDGTTHDDGSCAGDGTDHGGEPGGSGSPVSGKSCRIGQYVIGMAYDGGTPATNGDAIAWKWFAADAHKVVQLLPEIEAAVVANEAVTYAAVRDDWPPHLCWKEVLGGNLQLLTR